MPFRHLRRSTSAEDRGHGRIAEGPASGEEAYFTGMASI